MTKLKLLSAALIAGATLATPAVARTSHATSRHRARGAYASASPTARYIISSGAPGRGKLRRR